MRWFCKLTLVVLAVVGLSSDVFLVVLFFGAPFHLYDIDFLPIDFGTASAIN
jgi:hypothetical protein